MARRPKRPPPSPALTGGAAIVAMIQPFVAIAAILDGSAQDVLLKVLDAEEQGGMANRAYSNAWRELIQRAKSISPEVLKRARSARRAALAASAAYKLAIEPIEAAIYQVEE